MRAMVTGGARRVGAAIAKHLAENGFEVIIHYNNSDKDAKSIKLWADENNLKIELIKCDLLDLNATNNLIDEIENRFGQVDLLVNNASLFKKDELENFKVSSFQDHMTINCLSPTLMMKNFFKTQTDSKKICINILDQKVHNLNPDFFSYTISKCAFASATSLAAMACQKNQYVYSISPGLTLISGNQTEESFSTAWTKTPMGYGATPDAIARAVLFLFNNNTANGFDLVLDAGEQLLKRKRDVAFITD